MFQYFGWIVNDATDMLEAAAKSKSSVKSEKTTKELLEGWPVATTTSVFNRVIKTWQPPFPPPVALAAEETAKGVSGFDKGFIRNLAKKMMKQMETEDDVCAGQKHKRRSTALRSEPATVDCTNMSDLIFDDVD
jgi:hypothetical protein